MNASQNVTMDVHMCTTGAHVYDWRMLPSWQPALWLLVLLAADPHHPLAVAKIWHPHHRPNCALPHATVSMYQSRSPTLGCTTTLQGVVMHAMASAGDHKTFGGVFFAFAGPHICHVVGLVEHHTELDGQDPGRRETPHHLRTGLPHRDCIMAAVATQG